MAISLFAHNQKAYTAACDLLQTAGKAAVIHPTGTGKSFIAFKLCEAQADKKICWLAPSEQIFKMQKENLIKTGAQVPKNISFLTYAKLGFLTTEEMAALAPDYIILDEFHRCGAKVWGQGVANLLQLYPQAKLLGLSATPIRYLDQQRDIADELFQGNIASEITLGEAIVRGILNPPKYVLSTYAYQKDLEHYQYKVQHARNKAVRDTAAEYLEALRRALDKAEGLDKVFAKHLPDKQGKYLVFCANVEHLHAMQELAPSWFHLVDDQPRCYAAYAENPQTEAALEAFKTDDSPHIKLLFCVDMLNEGIHVADVNGVILLRPTVSPIIYKQQIGRALSASSSQEAVIFDIVLNIENLYSVAALEDEMQLTLAYYREHDLEEEIVNEQFHIIDEVRNCMELFQDLQTSLDASWELMYQSAMEYYQLHGDLQVPKCYLTKEGFSLGMWVNTQRRIRAGKTRGSLTAEQIAQLDAIGMVWLAPREVQWRKYYAAAQAYHAEHGNLLMNANTVYQGINLGNWLAKLRVIRKKGRSTGSLTKSRIKQLDDLGMVWDVFDYLWERNYQEAVAYREAHGDLEVPKFYVTESGIRLGSWIDSMRRTKAKLAPAQVEALDALGMEWKQRRSLQWEKFYAEAAAYYQKHGTLQMPVSYKTESGCALGRWLRLQRDKQAKLSKEQQDRLTALGMEWQDAWSKKFQLLQEYYEEHGNVAVPVDYLVQGVRLGRWLKEQQEKLNGGKGVKHLTTWQKEKLISVGLSRLTSRTAWLWEKQFAEAAAFASTHGHLQIPNSYVGSNGKKTALWLQLQREKYQQGKLNKAAIQRLSSIGMVWEIRSPWEVGIEHAREYVLQKGNLLVEQGYTCADGYALGNWIANQRNAYKKKKGLTEEQITQLNDLGMIWSLSEYRWLAAYKLAVQYFKEHGDIKIPSNYCTKDGYSLGRWLRNQKEKLGSLTEQQVEHLRKLGIA